MNSEYVVTMYVRHTFQKKSNLTQERSEEFSLYMQIYILSNRTHPMVVYFGLKFEPL